MGHRALILPRLWAVLNSNSMSISLDEVRHVAKLARLSLDESEILALQGDLNALLGHFADIQMIDAAGIEPQLHAVALQNVWAQDASAHSLARETILKNASSTRAGLFLVPTIIEE